MRLTSYYSKISKVKNVFKIGSYEINKIEYNVQFKIMRKNISELEQEEGVVWDLIDGLVDNAVVCIVMSCYFYKLDIWHILRIETNKFCCRSFQNLKVYRA